MRRVFILSLVALMTIMGGVTLIAANGSATVQQNQKKHVSGIVTDKSGAPVPGASVMIPGTSTGTVTGEDGRYSLDVPV